MVRRSLLSLLLLLSMLVVGMVVVFEVHHQPVVYHSVANQSVANQSIVDQPVIGSYEFHETYNLSWGVVEADTTVKKTLIREVILNISSHVVTPIIKNRTAKAVVVRFKALSNGGRVLWQHDSIPPYLWQQIDNGIFIDSGVAEPLIMVSNTGRYLFLVEAHSGPREIPDVRNWVGKDWLYVFGRDGLVKKLNLGKGAWPKRNIFMSSAGNYTILGFEEPQDDGSPLFGRVLIFNGTEVIFDKSFPYDPGCLCYVIPGWGYIDSDGHAVFGLYTGTGVYNGSEFYMSGGTDH